MDGLLSTIRDVFAAVWRVHFEIPEPVYWVVIVVAAAGFSVESPEEATAWTAALALGVQGVARWHHHRGRGRRALVVARFTAPDRSTDRAAEAQDLVLTRLRDKLSAADARRVHAVPAVVSPADRAAAVRLRKRLRAWLLVYGRVTDLPDGWAVFARVLTPESAGEHLDEHTRDATPIKRTWSERVEILSPTERVVAEEYPLVAAAELECLVRASAGQVALVLGEPQEARRLLEDALAVAPTSHSSAIDGVRVALATALLQDDEIEAALVVLRERAAGVDAAPELLRMLHRTLSLAAEAGLEEPDDAFAESVGALRRAAAQQADPQRDMTLFNLGSLLRASPDSAEQEEAVEIMRKLVLVSKRYRRAWYVHRSIGAAAWAEAVAAASAGDEELSKERYREAGRRYRRAIRLRPRIGFLVWAGTARTLWTVYPPAPILHANLADVHDALGRRVRSRWRWWRCERKRDKLMRRGLKRFAAGQWELAYANFDWVIVGRGDFRDLAALVYRAVAEHQYGDDEQALATWEAAMDLAPFALMTRAAMLRDPDGHPLIRGLPGDGPTDVNQVARLLGVPAPSAGPVPVMTPGWRARLFPAHERSVL